MELDLNCAEVLLPDTPLQGLVAAGATVDIQRSPIRAHHLGGTCNTTTMLLFVVESSFCTLHTSHQELIWLRRRAPLREVVVQVRLLDGGGLQLRLDLFLGEPPNIIVTP